MTFEAASAAILDKPRGPKDSLDFDLLAELRRKNYGFHGMGYLTDSRRSKASN